MPDSSFYPFGPAAAQSDVKTTPGGRDCAGNRASRKPSYSRVVPAVLAGLILAGCGGKPGSAVLISRHCWIDTINGAVAEEVVAERGPLKVTGWAADSTSGGTPEAASLQLLNATGNLVSAHPLTARSERPDVVEVNKQPGYAKSGFEITIDLAKTTPGKYAMSLAMQRDGAAIVCESSKKIVLN